MKCILILEDEPLIAMDLQLAFEDAGAEAVAVEETRVQALQVRVEIK